MKMVNHPTTTVATVKQVFPKEISKMTGYFKQIMTALLAEIGAISDNQEVGLGIASQTKGAIVVLCKN